MNYSDKLKDPRWQRKRLEILNRDKFTCQLCGDQDTSLHVHHKSYSNNPWETKSIDLITYCEHCHSIIEYLKSNKADNEIVKIFKKLTDDYPIFYAIMRGIESRRIGVLLFEYIDGTNFIEFRSMMFPDILGSLNKEIKKLKRKK